MEENVTSEQVVVKTVEIQASTRDVWRMLTEPDQIAKWMDGARVESMWEPGSRITFTGTMPNFNRKYRDRGTVLAVDVEKLLQYTHWSEMTRLPDISENRTVITFILDALEEKTRLTVRQENFHSEVAYKHANFFWGVALHVMKNLLEK